MINKSILFFAILFIQVSCDGQVENIQDKAAYIKEIANSKEYHFFRVSFSKVASVNPMNDNFDSNRIFDFIEEFKVDDHRTIDPALYAHIKGAAEYFELREALYEASDALNKKYNTHKLSSDERAIIRAEYYTRNQETPLFDRAKLMRNEKN